MEFRFNYDDKVRKLLYEHVVESLESGMKFVYETSKEWFLENVVEFNKKILIIEYLCHSRKQANTFSIIFFDGEKFKIDYFLLKENISIPKFKPMEGDNNE